MSKKKLFKPCSDCPLYTKKPINTNNSFPAFSFKYLQKGFHIDDCTQDEQIHLLQSIIKRSQITWGKLEQAQRHGLGKENISINSIKASIPTCIKGDTKLWAFRFYGHAPFVGFREGEIFNIVWIDRSFTLYNHE